MKKVLVGAVALLLLSPTFADELDPALLMTWEASWERVIDEALFGYLERAFDGSLSSLGEEDQYRAAELLYETLYPAVSWGALGAPFVDNMVAECGADNLQRITPYFTGESDSADMDPQFAADYSACAQSAVGKTLQMVTDVIVDKRPEISAIHAKFGIEYPGS